MTHASGKCQSTAGRLGFVLGSGLLSGAKSWKRFKARMIVRVSAKQRPFASIVYITSLRFVEVALLLALVFVSLWLLAVLVFLIGVSLIALAYWQGCEGLELDSDEPTIHDIHHPQHMVRYPELYDDFGSLL